MAVIDPSIVSRGAEAIVTWANIQPGDTINPVRLNGFGASSACLQVEGTFGGATARLDGSNDGTTYYDLKDIAAATIGLTVGGLVDLSTGALFLRPDVQGGAGYALNYTLVCRS